jgi:hypothetical protein
MIPNAFKNSILDLNDQTFYGMFQERADNFVSWLIGGKAVSSYWAPGTRQQAQLARRGISSPLELYQKMISNAAHGLDISPSPARGLSVGEALDPEANAAVSRDSVRGLLAARDFFAFAGGKASDHDQMTELGLLESIPHNLVHSSIGGAYKGLQKRGYMNTMMSPADPIFFLHHANLDRLWAIWTRKQQALGLPSLPRGKIAEDSDYDKWANKPLRFFVDKNGNPLDWLVEYSGYPAVYDSAGSGELRFSIEFKWLDEQPTTVYVAPQPTALPPTPSGYTAPTSTAAPPPPDAPQYDVPQPTTVSAQPYDSTRQSYVVSASLPQTVLTPQYASDVPNLLAAFDVEWNSHYDEDLAVSAEFPDRTEHPVTVLTFHGHLETSISKVTHQVPLATLIKVSKPDNPNWNNFKFHVKPRSRVQGRPLTNLGHGPASKVTGVRLKYG